MGKEPGMLAPMKGKVTVVACHPKSDILAAGYSDGTVMLVRLSDGAEILARREGRRAGLGAGVGREGCDAGVCDREGRRRPADAVTWFI